MRSFFRSVGIAGLAVLVAVVFLFSRRAEPGTTQPPIAWTPDHLVVALAPGETKGVQATATVRSTVPATVAEVVPALAPYVSVSPGAMGAVNAGSQVQFTVTFSVASGTPFQTVEGTLHLRADDNTVARPLPITINIWQRYTDPGGLFTLPYPPDLVASGPPGGLSLATIDRAQLMTDPEEVEARPEISVVTLPNPAAIPLNEFITRYDGGWFNTYISSSATSVAGRQARRFSDRGAPVGHAPLEAVFVDGGSFVLLVTLNDYESLKSDTQSELLERVLSNVAF